MGLLSISLSMLNVSISWPLIRITKKKRPEMKSTLKMKSHEESSRIGKEKTQPIRSLKLWSPTQSTQDTHRLDLGMVPRVGLGDNAPFQIWKAIRQQTSFMLQCWDLFFGIVHKVPAVIEAGNSFTINNLCRRLEASGRRKAWRSTTNESLLNRWSMVHETEIDSLNLWTSCPSTRPKGWIDSVISLRKHESNQEYASPILRFFMAGLRESIEAGIWISLGLLLYLSWATQQKSKGKYQWLQEEVQRFNEELAGLIFQSLINGPAR